LNREWERLVADPRAKASLSYWPEPANRFDDLGAVLAATTREGGLSQADADQVLGAVVCHAATDDLAARLVLQRVVSGLVLAAVRRTRGRCPDRQRLFDDLVGTAWILIRTYPLERRPVKIAVNILRDAEYLTCVRPRRLRSSTERATDLAAAPLAAGLDGRPSQGRRHPADELAEVLAAGREAGMPGEDLTLLRELYLDGRQSQDIARSLGVSPRTIYARRLAATARLAEVAQVAA
jgi:hypothetical protein